MSVWDSTSITRWRHAQRDVWPTSAVRRTRRRRPTTRGGCPGRSDQLGERREELRVVLRAPDGDAQRAGAPERRAGADEHSALGEAVDDPALVGVLREVEPDEVGLRVGGLEAEIAQPVDER